MRRLSLFLSHFSAGYREAGRPHRNSATKSAAKVASLLACTRARAHLHTRFQCLSCYAINHLGREGVGRETPSPPTLCHSISFSHLPSTSRSRSLSLLPHTLLPPSPLRVISLRSMRGYMFNSLALSLSLSPSLRASLPLSLSPSLLSLSPSLSHSPMFP